MASQPPSDEELRQLLAAHAGRLEPASPPSYLSIRRRARRRIIRVASASAASATVLSVAVVATLLAAGSHPSGPQTPASSGGQSPGPQTSAPASPPARPGHSSPEVPQCAARSLRLRLTRMTGATMPGTVGAVVFRNAGATTCELAGFPQVRLSGTNLPRRAVAYFAVGASWSVAKTEVRLRPGGSAAADLMIAEAVNPGPCGSRTWVIVPPGGGRATTLAAPPSWPDACTRDAIVVSPVYPGRLAPLTGSYPPAGSKG
jgi:Protein of unknown function (DUF4232)